MIPVIFGLPEEEEVAAERRELLERLEERKIAMVRKAVRQASLEMIKAEAPLEERKKKLAQVREEVVREAEAIAQAELDMFREAILRMAEAGLPAVERRKRIVDIMRLVDVMREAGAKVAEAELTTGEKLEEMREIIKEASVKVAKKPAAASIDIIADVVREVASKLAEAGPTEEAWDVMLQRSLSEYRKLAESKVTEEAMDIILKKVVAEYRRAQVGYRAVEETLWHKSMDWLRTMLRILAEAVTEERVPWTVERYVSQRKVAETRAAIREYTRDMSFNVLVIVLMVMVLAICLFLI